MIKRIYDYCRYDIPRGIKNLVIWFPTVWCDRQWDHQFIYIMLRQKLHFTEQFIRNHGVHVNNVEDADEIKTCVDILDRLIADVHHEEAFKRHHKIFGVPDLTWMTCKEIESDVDEYLKDDEFVQLDINYPNVKSTEDERQEKIGFHDAMQEEIYLREFDLTKLFLIMREHIQGWWD